MSHEFRDFSWISYRLAYPPNEFSLDFIQTYGPGAKDPFSTKPGRSKAASGKQPSSPINLNNFAMPRWYEIVPSPPVFVASPNASWRPGPDDINTSEREMMMSNLELTSVTTGYTDVCIYIYEFIWIIYSKTVTYIPRKNYVFWLYILISKIF